MSLPTQSDIEAAVRRIACTADGLLLYRHLQLVLMEVPPLGCKVGALRDLNGRRSLARELKALMDRELSQRGPIERPGDPHDPDRPAVTRPAEPVAISVAGLRRRVADYSDGDGSAA